MVEGERASVLGEQRPARFARGLATQLFPSTELLEIGGRSQQAVEADGVLVATVGDETVLALARRPPRELIALLDE